jgi:prevent-host-death family protein
MKRNVSVAEAKNNLPALVHDAEEQGAIGIQRRGKTVAVIVGLRDYERMRAKSTPSLLEQIMAIRQEHGMDGPGEGRGDEGFAVRDRTPTKPANFGR